MVVLSHPELQGLRSARARPAHDPAPNEHVIAELKTDEAKSMPIGQTRRLLAYARAGVEVYLWQPKDIEAIERRLR